ncbi:MAG: hypothetical protein K9N23_19870 [Akkermansiaceae bacterium]|nr:hypothetical protein [Akkermansiaceae bacterium]
MNPIEKPVGDIVPLTPSIGMRIGIIVFEIVLLAVFFAPFGLVMLLYPVLKRIGLVPQESTDTIFLFMTMVIAVGVIGIAVRESRVFCVVAFVLLVLAVLNIGGCCMMLEGLSGIH